ncbi:MAG: heme ABC exporter ATP-binding protein CcmA [Chloroflexi bacterium]|nr:heme ABC exporter ATP-binding protein CcmA [Chloroflexota bacterium]
MIEPLITVEKLDKTFGARWALRGISFRVQQGEIVALVGPNGAGKTTLLRILATLARPDGGRVYIGKIPLAEHANAARGAIGFVGHQTFMYDDLTAEENLLFFARLYDLKDIPDRVHAAARRVGIENRLGDVTRTLSRGLQQRLTIARMLLHDPVVLLLDEPYTGLDKTASDLLDQIMLGAKAEGRSILFSTHDLERGLAICDRALILRNGRMVYDLARPEWKDLAGFMEIYAHVLGDHSSGVSQRGPRESKYQEIHR